MNVPFGCHDLVRNELNRTKAVTESETCASGGGETKGREEGGFRSWFAHTKFTQRQIWARFGKEKKMEKKESACFELCKNACLTACFF